MNLIDFNSSFGYSLEKISRALLIVFSSLLLERIISRAFFCQLFSKIFLAEDILAFIDVFCQFSFLKSRAKFIFFFD